MPHIFVSHATADDALVTELHDAVETATGQDLWVDHKDIHPPVDWQEALERALKDMRALIVVITRASAPRPEVVAEWRAALLQGVPLLVVIADDIPPLDIPYRLRTLQPLRLHPDRAAGLKALAAAVSRLEAGTGDGEGPGFVRTAFSITGDYDAALRATPMRGRDDDLTAVHAALAKALVQVCGVGGLGKSRLAAEVIATGAGWSGALWLYAQDVTSPERLGELLRQHYRIDGPAEWEALLRRVRDDGHLLVVLDNAESIVPEARAAWAARLTELRRHDAAVLVTTRIPWPELKHAREHMPVALDAPAAAQIARDMAADLLPGRALTTPPEALAEAARRHPRLIEWALRQIKRLPEARVLDSLRMLTGRTAEEALDEMIGRTLDQMDAEVGTGPRWALRRLNVTRGGFTYAAAEALCLAEGAPLGDGDALDAALTTLQTWSFVTFDGARYRIDPLAAAAAGEDDAARRAHYDHYYAVAEAAEDAQHDPLRYQKLDVESANLEAALDWALAHAPEDAYRLFNCMARYLANRGRFAQRLEWLKRIQAALAGSGNERLKADAAIVSGNVYGEHPLGDRRANLQSAIAAYGEALHFYTADAAPLDYAMTQNNLGTAYSKMSRLEGADAKVGTLQRAIAASQEALRFYTADAAPLDYAATQNNLGTAYGELAGLALTPDPSPLGRGGLLRQAIAAFEEALRFYTADAAPLAYAGTQNNLGIAYRNLALTPNPSPEGRGGLLRRAIAAYQEALRFYTADAAPLDYAMTQANLGIAHEDLGDLAAAVACWRAAEIWYRRMGDVANADLMLDWIAAAGG